MVLLRYYQGGIKLNYVLYLAQVAHSSCNSELSFSGSRKVLFAN